MACVTLTPSNAQQSSSSAAVSVLGCSLEVIVDPTLYSDLRDRPDFGASRSRSHLDYAISSLVGRHVHFVNEIIGKYRFGGGGGGGDGGEQDYTYRLYLKRLKILTPSSCAYKGVDFCDESAASSPREFLDLHSTADHDDVCLSYVFTGRDFVDGSVGLAWTASTKGMCTYTMSLNLKIHLNLVQIMVASAS